MNVQLLVVFDAGRDYVASLQYGGKCYCDYCHSTDVELHKQERSHVELLPLRNS